MTPFATPMSPGLGPKGVSYCSISGGPSGGALQIESAPGHGTRLVAHIPSETPRGDKVVVPQGS